MKKILMITLLMAVLLLGGCNSTLHIYKDVGTCFMPKVDAQVECDNFCADDSLRITNRNGKSTLIENDCKYICDCS